MNSSSRRIALKVDCDTFEGTQNGIPQLLRFFDAAGIHASFFFTLGPDRSGRAIRRIFTQKGFLKKMLRSNAVSLYGPKTMLYGTLLPAPLIGKKLKSVIKSVAAAGHDVGVHGWDHTRWHDHLDQLSADEIERDYLNAHLVFQEIFGWSARSSAAPGWHVTPTSLAIQEKFNLLYTSDTRGGSPFYPQAKGQKFSFLEIPTTLPTWDEALTDPTLADPQALVDSYDKAIKGTEVHTIHTEVEGGVYSNLFSQQLDCWKQSGCTFLTLKDVAEEIRSTSKLVPESELTRVTIPNRGGFVSSRL